MLQFRWGCSMSGSTLRRKPKSTFLRNFKQRKSEHFYNEAEIMKDMIESKLKDKLSNDDIKELQKFTLNHAKYRRKTPLLRIPWSS